MPDNARRVWIASARYDLPLIILAPLFGLLICAIARVVGETTLLSHGFVEANIFVLGMPHYLSTYTFYMGDENLAHYRTRKLAFFIGPVLVVFAMIGALAAGLAYFVAAIVAVWNTYHVSRQSSGILSAYRHRAGGDNAREKWPALITLVGSAFALFMLGIDQQAIANLFGGRLLPAVHVATPIVFALAALGALRLAFLMVKRSAAPAEWLFLGSSILLFTPYLLVHSATLATSALLSGHFVQYMAMLWLINRRKYTQRLGSIAQKTLHSVASRPAIVVAVLLSFAIVPFAFDRVLHFENWMAFHTVWLNAIVLLHFYLDGLFWAFKDPYTRQSLGPFLVWHESLASAS